jgi:hypothetical protein
MLGRFIRKLISGDVPLTDERAQLLAGAATAFRNLDYGAARDALREAHARGSLDAEGMRMLGTSLMHSGNLEEAELALRGALALRADNVDVHRTLAMTHLMAGNWIEGFSRYEACRNAYAMHMPDQELNRNWLRCVTDSLQAVPLWRGDQALQGKKLLVWSEYGHGDAIMYLRFLATIRERFMPDEILFMSVAEERCLFEAVGGEHFVETEWGWRPQPGEVDFHCSLISLPFLLKIDTANVPAAVPYMTVPEEKRAHWAERMRNRAAFRVGVCWAGNPGMSQDRLRSLSLKQLRPLFGAKGVELWSLQKDLVSRLALQSEHLPITDVMEDCRDFMDTAAVIENLDLVISVDSAVAHLAGALGKPVWLLNRFESEWRWMRGREDSVWYPTMRIFNQPQPRDWDTVIRRVTADLSALAGQERSAVAG